MESFVGPSLPSRRQCASSTERLYACPAYRPRPCVYACVTSPQPSSLPVQDITEPTEPTNPALNDGDYFPDDADDDWYEVVKRVAKPDLAGASSYSPPPSSDGTVDLVALEDMGRDMLADASYDSVVDVDIQEGGVLADDADNNDLFCGVGLEALIESEQLLTNLHEDLKIRTATHVQLAAIPRVLDGRDMVIQSHTGTGKTLAFLLPILDEMDAESTHVQAVVVAPTRELAIQISRECERICENTGLRTLALIGGANPARQVEKLRRKQPHVVVGTPGRVAELHENRELHTRSVKTLVVDEVDQCVQGAFTEDVVYLLRAVPGMAQKILVSATSDVDAVRAFAGEHLHKPVLLRVGGSQRLPKSIRHWCCVVPARMRIELLRKLMHVEPMPTRAIVFVDDPRRVDMVVERLYQMGVSAAGLRGNAHKLERAEVLTAFRKGRVTLLVTTEVAARGLDVKEISHVFNLDLPTDADHYVHRAGRCGRVGMEGTVVSVATGETAFVIGRLAKELGVEIQRMEPRGGAYAAVLERRKEGRGGREGVRRTRAVRKEPERPEKRTEVMSQKPVEKSAAEESTTEESRFESAEVVDGLAMAQMVELLGDQAKEPVVKTTKTNPVTKTNSVTKTETKNKTKSEKRAVKETEEKRRKKVNEKKRSRWNKDKGKPRGKVGNAIPSEAEGQQRGQSSSDKSSATNQQVPANDESHRRPKDLGVRAAKEGWVGNR